MKCLIVYCSQPASGQMATFLMSVQMAQHVVIRPVTALPAPDPIRRQKLRLLRSELEGDIAQAVAELAGYASGKLQPDAGRESGLRFDLEALRRRVAGLNTVLGTEKGGADNG